MDQPGPSRSGEEINVPPQNAATSSNLPEDPPVNRQIDTIDVNIPDPGFSKYLKDSGALEAINRSLTTLYYAEPKPELAKEFLWKQLTQYCNTPIDPLMQLVEMKEKIQQLEVQYKALREEWVARIQKHDQRNN